MDEKLAQLLVDLPEQFRAAMQAEIEFHNWRAWHRHAPNREHARRFAELVETSTPYAEAYEQIAHNFPSALPRVDDMLLPIQREFFP